MRGKVLCLYVIEPDYWQLPDTSERQWLAIADGLRELDADLHKIYGAHLTILTGDVIDIMRQIHKDHGIKSIHSHEETGNLWTFERDKNLHQLCRKQDIKWHEYQQFGVFRGLKNRDIYAKSWERFMSAEQFKPPQTLDIMDFGVPNIPTCAELGLHSAPCPARQKGGRKNGIYCLKSFIEERGARYQFQMSSPLTAPNACSRLSLHIATGTLSMREIVQHIYKTRTKLCAQLEESRSISLRALDSFTSRLHWHCHFIQKLEREPELETRSAHPLYELDRHNYAHNEAYLEAWITGQTGFPFVDACMRSLIATGWINFRMRAMLMAFASYHLGLDWTKSGAALAQLFTDYEPGIHWPQVQMQSGQTGINIPRIYNPVKQSFDQDKDGVFIRQWVGEIAYLPLQALHEPWILGSPIAHYPPRIVDHIEAARAAKLRITNVRKQEGYNPSSQQVFVKHGSRKKQNDRPKLNKKEVTQLSLNL